MRVRCKKSLAKLKYQGFVDLLHGQRGMKRGAAEKMRGPATPRLV